MSFSLIASVVWALAATVVAFLPMRYQYVPGVALLVIAPFLIFYVGYQHGYVIAGLALAAFVSMFRNPLIYFYRRARGERPNIPK